MMQTDAVFTNLKVLELASVLAGPTAGQFFAELGAEVIKVENPKTGGDVTRTWKSAGEQTDDRSAYFCSCNWGKKSVCLDLTLDGDLEIVRKLASKSDIIVASYKPGDAEKLGVDYQSLSKSNPGLIYGMITGYGSDDDRVGYDAVVQAESGFMDINGEAGGQPIKMPVALIDVLAAHQLKEGLLVALLQRTTTNRGQLVEVSLFDTALASLANQATNWLVGGKEPSRKGSAHPNIAPYGDVFQTADGKRILLAVGNDRQFNDLLAALEQEKVKNDSRFSSNQKRVENRTELNQLLAARMKELDSTTILSGIRKRKIPAGLVQSVKQALEGPGSGAMLLNGGGLKGVRTLVGRSSSLSKLNLTPPPHLGEHTEEVVGRLRGEL